MMQVTLETLEFSPLERKFYDSLYTTAKRQYTAYQNAGAVGKNYGRILYATPAPPFLYSSLTDTLGLALRSARC